MLDVVYMLTEKCNGYDIPHFYGLFVDIQSVTDFININRLNIKDLELSKKIVLNSKHILDIATEKVNRKHADELMEKYHEYFRYKQFVKRGFYMQRSRFDIEMNEQKIQKRTT